MCKGANPDSQQRARSPTRYFLLSQYYIVLSHASFSLVALYLAVLTQTVGLQQLLSWQAHLVDPGREDSAALATHAPCHLLPLEHLTRILAATSRPSQPVSLAVTVTGAATSEAPALHDTLEALTDGGAGHIHILPRHKVCCIHLSAHRQYSLLYIRTVLYESPYQTKVDSHSAFDTYKK